MNVFICGIDGYLGWTLAQYLSERDHTVEGCDNLLRRRLVEEVGSQSVIPIADPETRANAIGEKYGTVCHLIDLLDYGKLSAVLEDFKPDAIVHLGEIPSAPYSMIDADAAYFTQENNVLGSLNLLFAMRDHCPEAQLVKLGTMGEYGTPNVDIPEGNFDMEFRGRTAKNVVFPRDPGSFYHLTKVHDTYNTILACRIWGLRSTDIMQGVVFGTRIPEIDSPEMMTRFDIDESFGTAINRFVASAVVDHPMTLFGAGHQKRGFLPLCDSMQCMTLAIENAPEKGEYRTWNQFEEVYDLTELANKVQTIGKECGLDPKINNYTNPRVEQDDHYYNPDHQKLIDIGYEPTHDMDSQLRIMFKDLLECKDRIEQVKDVLIPKIRWSGDHSKSAVIK